ncbi:MAG: SpoIID/LytB domain-containing protein [Myxococcales bacterium]|nr:SpoIID/LytB domain-containing protein [Myxococcales bacterium]
MAKPQAPASARSRVGARRTARPWLVQASAALVAMSLAQAQADDTSATDKLRILYSSRFTFTDDGLPLVTVEIVSGVAEAKISAKGGLVVRPDGVGGSAVEVPAGAAGQWTVRAEATRPALLQEWTVVETLSPDDARGITAALARWKERGFEPRTFEIGTMFGVDGELIDTRDVRVCVDPVAAGKGAARAAELATRFGVATSVHQELVRRPAGTIVAESGGVVVRNPSVLWFTARRTSETVTVADVPTGTGGSQLETGKADRRYWGSVYVTLAHDGKLVVANALPENKLLEGLVPSEIFPESPDAALEAQAIAARTELLQKIGRRNLTDPFLLCSTQQCQVYAGAGQEHPRTSRAVAATRGLVLLRDGGGLVDVRYSASCGGHSEHNEHVWGGEPDPSLRGHADAPKARQSRMDEAAVADFLQHPPDDAWCARAKGGASRFRWTQTVSAEELTRRVAAAHPQVGRVLALTPSDRGASGRARQLTIRGDRGSAEVTGELVIRRLLGGLKSSLFTVEVQGPRKAPAAFVFHGGGFGHGVGMCQMGAIGMAEAGKHRGQILSHYFLGTKVHKLY